MAAPTGFVLCVLAETVPVGHGTFLSYLRQVGVRSGGRVGNVLTQELLAYEQAASSGRRFVRLRSEGKKQSLAQQSGALRVLRKRDRLIVVRWRGNTIDL